MLKIYRYISGYLRVIFYGEFTEKIFNLTAKNRITLWDSKLVKKGIETSVSVKDFKRLPDIIRSSGIRVHIIKKCGLPFKTHKNRKRVGLVIGFALLIFILKFMSGYIWIIDVVGNEKVPTKEILSACEAVGIKDGIRKNRINTKIKREELLLQIDTLSWASLNIEGSVLTVNVSEIKKVDEDNSCSCNLKAKADGIIEKIDVTSGNCVVKTGDTVKKGDILVSGILEKLNGTEFVHSAGTVTAVTQRSITVEEDYKTVIETENGKSKTKKVLEFFGVKIPLFLGKETSTYKSTLKEKPLSVFGRVLPITIYSKEFNFTDKYEYTRSYDEVCAKLEEKVGDNLKLEGVNEYKIIRCDFAQKENAVSLTAIVSATENIVYREALLIKPE